MKRDELNRATTSFVNNELSEFPMKSMQEMFEQDVEVAQDHEHMIERLTETIEFIECYLDVVRQFVKNEE